SVTWFIILSKKPGADSACCLDTALVVVALLHAKTLKQKDNNSTATTLLPIPQCLIKMFFMKRFSTSRVSLGYAQMS
ncbi:MAG: hypothetical protein ACREO5_11020, partial [Candidatus Binatia bacterium]